MGVMQVMSYIRFQNGKQNKRSFLGECCHSKMPIRISLSVSLLSCFHFIFSCQQEYLGKKDVCRLHREESIFDSDTSDWVERMHVWYGCVYGWRWLRGITHVQKFGTPFHYYSTTRH